MIGEKFNYQDTFFRDLTLCVLDTLEGEIRWSNRFSSGLREVVVPFYYSLTGDERFLMDSFNDDIVNNNRFVDLNTDQIPRAHLTMTGYDIRSDEFSNPNVWLKMVLENQSEIRRVLAKIRAVPVTVKYDMTILLSSEIDIFKCNQAIMDTLWLYRFMYFEYNFMNIDAVMLVPDGTQVEIQREKSLTSDNTMKITLSFEVQTYYPAFRKPNIRDLESGQFFNNYSWSAVNNALSNSYEGGTNNNSGDGGNGFGGGTTVRTGGIGGPGLVIVRNSITNNVIITFRSGTGIWTVPSGITSVRVELWGAGGCGGSSTTDGLGGSGGGSGAYTVKTFGVVEDETYFYSVGRAVFNQPGGSTTFVGPDSLTSINLSANGGGKGGDNLNLPGIGGVSSGGDLGSSNGESGEVGTINGGKGGDAPNGGSGGAGVSGGVGQPGNVPGGGGGGAGGFTLTGGPGGPGGPGVTDGFGINNFGGRSDILVSPKRTRWYTNLREIIGRGSSNDRNTNTDGPIGE